MSEIIITGPEGRLEGKYHHYQKGAPIAMVLHNHPSQGGDMNNKIVYALYHRFVSNGYNTIRFNFRGVGKSEGIFDSGDGELADAATVIDWLQHNNHNYPHCMVAGFSFGAWIAMQLLMRRPEIDNFLAVSPPAKKYDFSFLAPCPVSGSFIYGNNDSYINHENVSNLAHTIMRQKSVEVAKRMIEGADHNFTNTIEKLVLQINKSIPKIPDIVAKIA